MVTTSANNHPHLTDHKSYYYRFRVNKKPSELFNFLLDINNWWVGIFDETITGDSTKLNEEFTFAAGGGMHYSKYKLVSLVPNQKMVWEVIDSKLSFLEAPDEWTGTTMGFELEAQDGATQVTFAHFGLVPQFECYDRCTSAWTLYMDKLVQLVTH
ncbi:MAG: SRPBCC domain-containing protein [Gelidibacter sp.]